MHKQRIQLSRFFNEIESTLLECENLSDTFLKDWIKAKNRLRQIVACCDGEKSITDSLSDNFRNKT